MPTRSGTRSTSKKIVETIAFQIATEGVDHGALVDQMMVDYHGTSWCELAILLSALRALALTHQMSHWTSSGDPFYGDHLLFDRLYNGIVPEIDKVAEKTVGMGGQVMLHPIQQVTHETLLVQAMCGSGAEDQSPEELVKRSYEAEMHFLGMLEVLSEQMKKNSTWSLGVENMLGEIADNHEASIFLLKQRLGK